MVRVGNGTRSLVEEDENDGRGTREAQPAPALCLRRCRVRALDPELVWLAHEHEPWRPRTV